MQKVDINTPDFFLASNDDIVAVLLYAYPLVYQEIVFSIEMHNESIRKSINK